MRLGSSAIMKYLAAWLACFLFFATVLSLLSPVRWIALAHLTQHGVATEGRISEHDASGHYFYKVGGLLYSGVRMPDGFEPLPDKLAAGSRFMVFYDPAHPANSAAADPRSILQDGVTLVALMSLTIATGCLLIWRVCGAAIMREAGKAGTPDCTVEAAHPTPAPPVSLL